MIRQFAAESHDGYALRLDPSAAVWTRPEQFELLCSFAGTMAEDLFAAGRLRGVAVNGGPLLDTRRLRDIEAFLDALALLQPDRIEAGCPHPDELSGRTARRGRGRPAINPKRFTGKHQHLRARRGARRHRLRRWTTDCVSLTSTSSAA